MPNLKEIITFEYESAYDCAYDLSVKKNYSSPKIYTAKGDLQKRWYVYFSFRNPKTGKLKRVSPFYGDTQKYKTKEDRLFVLSAYRKKLIELLKKGYNPFEDNTELFNKLSAPSIDNSIINYKQSTIVESIETKVIESPITESPINQIQNNFIEPTSIIAINEKTIAEAFDFALKIKKKTVGKSTYNAYKGKCKTFQLFIANHFPEVKEIHLLTKKMVMQFLNDVLQRTSSRTRNNTRVELSSLFQTLEDNEIITTNFVKNIPVLKSIPERNKTYANELQEDIFKHLEESDPILLLYIKFISYNFLRPIEVNRLTVGDINLNEKTLRFKAKSGLFKTKIIPDILIDDLPDLSMLNKENPLFSPNGYGKIWDTSIHNRRDYFSKRFKKNVKAAFNLGADYGLYSFRHTFITKLYREFAKQASPFEAKSNLMLISGHASMSALEKYLRDIDAELPVDYSHLIRTQ